MFAGQVGASGEHIFLENRHQRVFPRGLRGLEHVLRRDNLLDDDCFR